MSRQLIWTAKGKCNVRHTHIPFLRFTLIGAYCICYYVLITIVGWCYRVRLISLAAQKFISDIANDALQHCKVRSSSQASKTKGKDRRYTLTMEDLTPALAEYGVQVRKPNYFV